MPKYKVRIIETLMRHADCVVEAPTPTKARALALKVKNPKVDKATEEIIERDVWDIKPV
jgi:hypothetical protein